MSSSLPPDLLEQVRSRISVLALIILIAFSFDPLLYVLVWVLAKLLGYPAYFGNLGFRLVDLCAVAASVGPPILGLALAGIGVLTVAVLRYRKSTA